MKLLLDTKVLLIWLGQPSRISAAMADAILSDTNEIFFSPLNIRECRIKAAGGGLKVPGNLLEVIHSKRFDELRFTAAHADETRNLPPLHRDPFDRGLIAQATVEGMCILSTDRQLPRYDVTVRLV